MVGYYDPWLDYNDDGDIDMKDVAATAKAFGSFGDPTKNVNVINGPVSSDVTVWYNRYVSTAASSGEYEASGFGQLHVLMYASGLESEETVGVSIVDKIWNEDQTEYIAFTAHKWILTSSLYCRAITIPVPSDTFSFYAHTGEPGSNCYIYVSFYLTWA